MSLKAFRLALRRLFRNEQVERDLADEVSHLVEMTVDELMRQGLPRRDAERTARLQLGNPEVIKETVRDAGWESVVETFARDVRYAFRGLRRNLAFTLAAILTLTLGIGATTAMFSVVNGVMLRPLPYHDWRQLALLRTDDVKRGLHNEATTYVTVTDWQRENRVFEDVAFFATERTTISALEGRERTRLALISPNLFSLLAVWPMHGRWLTDEDMRSRAPVAVISASLWQRRFNRDLDIVGKQLQLEEWQGKGKPPALTIVGVMPDSFYFPDRLTHIWTPATVYWRWERESTERFVSWARRWTGIARLKPGTSMADARSDLARVSSQLAAVHQTNDPDFPGFAVNVIPILDTIAGPGLQLALWLLMGAVALVLLIACANVGNLLLARGAARQHEMGVRRALGASRGRLVRQLLVESFVLSLLGGASGVLLAAGTTRVLSLYAADRLPRTDEIALDGTVLSFAVLVSVMAGLLFGLVPALRSTERTTSGWLKEATAVSGTPRVRFIRGVLVVAECGLAVVLLVGAGLLLRSLARVNGIDPGFDPRNTLVLRIEFPSAAPVTDPPPGDSGAATATMRAQTMEDLLARVRALPTVESTSFIDDLFIATQGHASVTFPGRDASTMTPGELTEGATSADFFTTMRVPLKRGRYLQSSDSLAKIRALWAPMFERGLPLTERARRALTEPAVVNEAFVQRYLGDRDPLRERFCIDPTGKTYCYEIVGVVGNMRRQGPERPPIPEYFGPFIPTGAGRGDLVVRASGDVLAMVPMIRTLINDTIPGALVPQIRTGEAGFGDFTRQRSFQTSLLTLFACLALALAAVGIYGVVHYAVSQRTREIALRVALGARPRDVRALVLLGGMRLPLIGIALGVIASFALTSLLSQLVFEIQTTDALTFAAVPFTLTSTALVACYAPARRASRVDTVRALRLD
jgi:predicted permease